MGTGEVPAWSRPPSVTVAPGWSFWGGARPCLHVALRPSLGFSFHGGVTYTEEPEVVTGSRGDVGGLVDGARGCAVSGAWWLLFLVTWCPLGTRLGQEWADLGQSLHVQPYPTSHVPCFYTACELRTSLTLISGWRKSGACFMT